MTMITTKTIMVLVMMKTMLIMRIVVKFVSMWCLS